MVENEPSRRHLENIVLRRTRQLRRTFSSAIDGLICTLEARDPYTTDHSLRVRRQALRLAGALRLDRQQRHRLGLAAKLHDIGKVGVPEDILNKPGPLSPVEYRRVQEHPIIGERIVQRIIKNKEVLAAVRAHHERYDGEGYPDGLKGHEIPLLARIIAVVDCFDALTSERSYRQALAVDQAREILRRGAGTCFDPAFVETFLHLNPEW